MAEPAIDDERIAAVCRVLLDHRVDFVVIGGVAARLHDTGHATVDIDICPSSVEENLERLSAALRTLDARLRVEGEPSGVAFDPHPQQLRQMSTLTLLTVHGPVDLCFAPAGFADVATLAVGLAQGSGEELEEQVDETELVEEHAEQGELVLPWAIAVTVAAAAVAAVPVLERRRPTMPARAVTAAVVAVSLVAGAGATWTVVEVGHSGAKATWDDVADEDGG